MQLPPRSKTLGILSVGLGLSATAAPAQPAYDWDWVCRNVPAAADVCRASGKGRTPEILKIGKDAMAFHADKFVGGFAAVTGPEVPDAEIFVEMIGMPNLAAVSALQLTILRSRGFKNAAALYLSEPLPGERGPQGPLKVKRLIVYDPEWARTANAEFYLVLGHEAGHHFCGHTLGKVQASPHEMELEADRFSGAAIKSFEVYHGKNFIDGALKAAADKYSEHGSRSHPPKARRIDAILSGYKQGWPCGNLAPAQRGFTRQQR